MRVNVFCARTPLNQQILLAFVVLDRESIDHENASDWVQQEPLKHGS